LQFYIIWVCKSFCSLRILFLRFKIILILALSNLFCPFSLKKLIKIRHWRRYPWKIIFWIIELIRWLWRFINNIWSLLYIGNKLLIIFIFILNRSRIIILYCRTQYNMFRILLMRIPFRLTRYFLRFLMIIMRKRIFI